MRQLGLRGVIRGRKGKRTTCPEDRREAAARSRDASVRGDATEATMGCGSDVRRDGARVRLRGVRDRRLRPPDRGLARVELAAERSGARCPGAGALRAPARNRHSDRGVQYLSIRYTERLAEAGIEPSVGSAGDSYDNALAESIIGLYKTEEIRRRGPWKGVEEVGSWGGPLCRERSGEYPDQGWLRTATLVPPTGNAIKQLRQSTKLIKVRFAAGSTPGAPKTLQTHCTWPFRSWQARCYLRMEEGGPHPSVGLFCTAVRWWSEQSSQR
jgi:transposase InsO family protein